MATHLPEGPPPQVVTEDQLDWITELVDHAADSRLKRYRNRAVGGFLVLAVGIGVAVHGNARAIDEVVSSSTAARDVLCQLIISGDQQTYVYGHEGTLTDAQVQRALKQSAEARKTLKGDLPAKHCTITITPESKPKQ